MKGKRTGPNRWRPALHDDSVVCQSFLLKYTSAYGYLSLTCLRLVINRTALQVRKPVETTEQYYYFFLLLLI